MKKVFVKLTEITEQETVITKYMSFFASDDLDDDRFNTYINQNIATEKQIMKCPIYFRTINAMELEEAYADATLERVCDSHIQVLNSQVVVNILAFRESCVKI